MITTTLRWTTGSAAPPVGLGGENRHGVEATDADLLRALASAGPREAERIRPWLRAAALGPTAWLASYVLLPLAKVYQPIWKYDARTLGKDLSAHLVFGAATGTAFAVLTHRQT